MSPYTRSLTIFTLFFTGLQATAQLNIQSGATFHMQAGATVTVEGNVDNAGTLNNDGTLKVQGNYSNTGTYTSIGTAGSLEMIGSGNANIAAGGSAIPNLVINKGNATDVVKLTASAVVTNSLTHTNGVFTTDPIANPAFSLSAPVAAVFNFAPGKEIIGRVQRTGWTNGAARVFNQPNMQLTTNGGTAPTDVTVIMIPLAGGGDPVQTEREVKRKFNFLQTGGSGFTADIRYPYTATELNTNAEANLVPWTLVSGEWNARLTPISRDLVNDYVSTTGITATAFTQDWKLADPNYTFNLSANLRGPWNGTTAMNTSLNSGGLIPLNQPYNTIPFNYTGTESVGSIPANVVDWVLIEHRKPISGMASDALVATITNRKAGFLLSNGTVVDLDGVTPIHFDITKQGTAFITVRHRNHLGVLSNNIPSNESGTFANDFNSLASVYKPVGAFSDPEVLLPGITGKYGMWPGDANKNGSVSGTDISAIKLAAAILTTGYILSDANMSGATSGTDVSLTRLTTTALGSGSGTNSFSPSQKKSINVSSNLPDPIIE